jgi:hypothetical protein
MVLAVLKHKIGGCENVVSEEKARPRIEFSYRLIARTSGTTVGLPEIPERKRGASPIFVHRVGCRICRPVVNHYDLEVFKRLRFETFETRLQ